MRIVFQAKDPDSPDLTFVGIEDDHGRSIRVGQWSDEGDGRRVLTLPDPPDSRCPAVVVAPPPPPQPSITITWPSNYGPCGACRLSGICGCIRGSSQIMAWRA